MKKTSVLLVDRHPALVESIRDLLKTMFDTVVMVSGCASGQSDHGHRDGGGGGLCHW